MDGSNRQVLVTGVCAMSLALDYEANDLYWADQNTGNIECISLNGGGKRIVSAQGSKGQDSLGISLSGGRVYWTSYSNGTVKSITKSGSTMKQHSLPAGRSGELLGIVFVLKQCPKFDARALAVDYETDDLYWTEYHTGNVECIFLYGGRKRLISAQPLRKFSYGISLTSHYIFWTSTSSTGTLHSMTKSGMGVQLHDLPAGRSGHLRGAAFVPNQCPKNTLMSL
ncbi:hypothetical protein BV898_17948 [Hypsibius exemplaris]|uniref:Uncharacterized protein n=1 Tax=Hypsibius exemplaris TaxID=2072580 RepID=A0A9X6NGG7_HYPEX|nr:hypothetical protein BV898_17948 [Hypsibius exemplaris]